MYGRLSENRSVPVGFDAPDGDETTAIYVIPGHVTYFEETSAFEDRGPFMTSQ